jgi:hypothetical protein
MTPCKGNTSSCDGRDLAAVKLPLRSIVVVMCAACREVAVGMGLHLTVVERRVTDIPVEQERRSFRPRWLSHLRGRDETGRLVA